MMYSNIGLSFRETVPLTRGIHMAIFFSDKTFYIFFFVSSTKEVLIPCLCSDEMRQALHCPSACKFLPMYVMSRDLSRDGSPPLSARVLSPDLSRDHAAWVLFRVPGAYTVPWIHQVSPHPRVGLCMWGEGSLPPIHRPTGGLGGGWRRTRITPCSFHTHLLRFHFRAAVRQPRVRSSARAPQNMKYTKRVAAWPPY